MNSPRNVVTWEVVATLALIAVTIVTLVTFIPPRILIVILAVTVIALVYFTGVVALLRHPEYRPQWFPRLPFALAALFPVTVAAVLLYTFRAAVTVVTVVFVLGLLFVFLYYWLVVPVALMQKLTTQGWTRPDHPWPPITVLIPAYNEEHYVGRCIDSVTDATYEGDVDVVVVDDGSTDGTYAEAREHATPATTVLRKPNGGKHSALNYGLEHATTDIIVSVDADSRIAADALPLLVQEFDRRPSAGAIAGNVKVDNRGTLVTNLQALEYIIGINTFRRAFDLLGIVTVVPGSLGAFRREVLADVRGYSADTLTEDFDLTVEILKRGHTIHASEGVVYTEAPDTWRDLERQRRRWFRGNLQTLVKHVDVFTDSRFGLLHRLGFPYVFLSMSLLPLLGVLILFLIVGSLVTGDAGVVARLAVLFVVLQTLLAALAIEIEGDELRYALLAPLTLFGYKQFMDVVLLKSVYDVFVGGNLTWTTPQRVRQRNRGRRDEDD